MTKIGFISTIFYSDVPNEYQGSHEIEEPLDILYALAATRNCGACYLIDVWTPQAKKDLDGVNVLVFSTTSTYLQWNNHPLGLDIFLSTWRQAEKLLGDAWDATRKIIFGPHVPSHHHELYDLGADVVLCGEAELSVPLAVEVCMSGETPTKARIPGYVERGSVEVPTPTHVKDLEALPTPAYDLSVSRASWAHNHPGDRTVGHLYETSRGCPFFCSFCNTVYHRRKYRTKSPEKIREDLSFLQRVSCRDYVYLIDESFGFKDEWFDSILPVLEEFPFTYGCQGNLLFMTEEKLEKMSRAGFISIEFGFETGSEGLLKSVRKNNRLDTAPLIINKAADLGMNPLLFVLLGLPGESHETLQETVQFFRQLSPQTRFSAALPTPYIGTRLHKQAVEENVLSFHAKGRELYQATGRVGHQLNFSAEARMKFQGRYGPNNYLTTEVIDQFERDAFELFSSQQEAKLCNSL